MKPCIYARVSTHDQTHDSQVLELRQFCQQRGWPAPLEFSDVVTGSKPRRPGLDALMTAARRRQVDAVIVYRFDRFARSVQQLVEALEEFRSLGVQFISLHEQIDTTTPNGRFFFTVFAAIAEFEKALIGERVRSGVAAARARGKRLGRAPSAKRNGPQAARVPILRAAGRSWLEIHIETGLSVPLCRRIVAEDRARKEAAKIPPPMG